jgi:hypothetical protein
MAPDAGHGRRSCDDGIGTSPAVGRKRGSTGKRCKIIIDAACRCDEVPVVNPQPLKLRFEPSCACTREQKQATGVCRACAVDALMPVLI